jgi:hypothetical protein
MANLAAADDLAVAGPRIRTESLRAVLLWLMAFCGGIVFIEPGPYEVVGLVTLVTFAMTGLSLRPALAPLVLLLILLNVGYTLSLFEVADRPATHIWVLVSVFLSGTAIFFAGMLGTNTEARLRWLMRGYVAVSVIVALIAVAAYFRLLGGMSDLFVIFSRAKGTFKDPNVFGAFLILPGLLMLQRILAGRRFKVLGSGLLLLMLMAGLFLSFSRAAWGQFVFCALILMALTYATTRSPNERFRIVLVAIAGLFVLAVFVAALLSIDRVAELFEERAALTQSYDTGHSGRFGRYLLAIQMVLDYPFGMGPLQFQFPEAPHNTYLNSFITGGWIAGGAYLTLTLVTLTAGLRFAFVATPWRPTYQAVYAAYIGLVAESVIIDSDHWRHYFLVLGVLWGLMVVSRAYLIEAREERAQMSLQGA